MIKLSRNIPIQTFDAEATVAFGQDRPEFLAVARLARDLKRPLTGGIVTRELLGGLPEQVGWRVIDRCVTLGLLQKQEKLVTLTLSGAQAVEQGVVLVPEEGIFRFYYAEDPLIDQPLLHVIRLRSPSASDEKNGLYKEGQRQRPSVGQAAPAPLKIPDAEQVLQSISGNLIFSMRERPQLGEKGSDEQLRLDVTFQPSKAPVVRLTGTIKLPDNAAAMRVDYPLPAATALQGWSYHQLWIALVAHTTKTANDTLNQWQQRTNRLILPVSFQTTKPEEQFSFKRNIGVQAFQIQKLGSFDPPTFPEVDLAPASDNDAQLWLQALQWETLQGNYHLPATLLASATELQKKFPFHTPKPLSPNQLLEQAQRQHPDRRAWNLLAPYDLGIWSRS